MAYPKKTTPVSIDAFVQPCVLDFYLTTPFLLRWRSWHPQMDVKWCVREQWYCFVVVIVTKTSLCCIVYSSFIVLWKLVQQKYWFVHRMLFLLVVCMVLEWIQSHSSNCTRNSNFCITDLVLTLKKSSHHDNNDECMLLEDMQHSHSQIILHPEVIYLSWYGRKFCKVESLIRILLSSTLSSFIIPSSWGLTVLSWISLTENLNNNFGINYFWSYHQ